MARWKWEHGSLLANIGEFLEEIVGHDPVADKQGCNQPRVARVEKVLGDRGRSRSRTDRCSDGQQGWKSGGRYRRGHDIFAQFWGLVLEGHAQFGGGATTWNTMACGLKQIVEKWATKLSKRRKQKRSVAKTRAYLSLEQQMPPSSSHKVGETKAKAKRSS